MKDNLYNSNGLLFWTEEEINRREGMVVEFTDSLRNKLLSLNAAFKFVRVEASIITPKTLIGSNYTSKDVFVLLSQQEKEYQYEDDCFVLRPETTMGSYVYAKKILSGYNDIKYRPPIVVWQHGKSFRKEQDQPTKFMRLKEFYQLEYQILFTENTANDYYPHVVSHVKDMISSVIGECKVEASDRLPSYSMETTDIVYVKNDMEVCSISRRKDYDGLKNIEVAIGTDRCIYNFELKNSLT